MTQNTEQTSQQESGQALVEFALVLLFVILPLIFVMTDGAITLYTYAVVTNAAREGARAGSIFQTTVAPTYTVSLENQVAAIDNERTVFINQQTQQQIGPLVSYPQCSTVITYTPSMPALGNPYRQLDSLSVTLACPRQLLFGLIQAGQITLTGQSTMRIEPGGVALPTPTPGP